MSRETTAKSEDAAALTAKVLKAYLPRSGVAPAELPALVREVRAAFEGRPPDAAFAPGESSAPRSGTVVANGSDEEHAPAIATPAVPIAESVREDFLISLEDGGRYRSLRRHLMSKYGLSPEQYREKWGLPPDYPMVAPSYSRARSDVAKRIGLGGPRDRARNSALSAKNRSKTK